jgi:glycosyltransferase involved in cell wall biosynthesis
VKPVKVVALPRDANPYQELLYGQMRELGAQVDYVPEPTRSHSVNLLLLPLTLVLCRLRGYSVLHLHWVYRFVLPVVGDRPAVRSLMERWFALVLLTSRLAGLRLVWTAHNVLPHEQVFRDDLRARRLLLRRCDAVLVHTPAAQRELARLAGADAMPLAQVVAHGAYTDVYGRPVTAAEARSRLDLPGDARVLLFFGIVQSYKGVEDLVAAVAGLAAAGQLPDAVRVLVAGRCEDALLRRRLERAVADGGLGGTVQLRLGHVPDDEVSTYFYAADAVVLPFRTVTTSGSALLPASFGRLVLVPSLPGLTDLCGGGVEFFEPGLPGLQSALVHLLSRSPDELLAEGERGRQRLGQLDWSTAARATVLLMRQLVAGEDADPGAVEPRLDEVRGTVTAQ